MAITRASGKIILLQRTGTEPHGAYHFCCFFQGMFCLFSVYAHNVYTFFCIEHTCSWSDGYCFQSFFHCGGDIVQQCGIAWRREEIWMILKESSHSGFTSMYAGSAVKESGAEATANFIHTIPCKLNLHNKINYFSGVLNLLHIQCSRYCQLYRHTGGTAVG